MRAFIFAAGDRYAAEADFNDHSADETVLYVASHDVDMVEFRQCDGDLTPLPYSFSTQRSSEGAMYVIYAVYA